MNLARHDDVVGFARRVGGDVGSLDNLDTVTKEDIVAATNSLVSRIEWLEFGTRSLFLRGEQGIWLDPSDLSTMFQDVRGSKTVTKDGDPVGLILDKSQGLFSGDYIDFNLLELNPEKSDDGATVTHTDGAIIYDIKMMVTSNALVVPYTKDNVYSITLDIENLSSGTIEIKSAGGGAAPTITKVGANEHLKGTFTYRASSNTKIYLRTSSAKLKINSIKIKEVKGNHAIQETAAARPVYRTDGELHWLEFDGVDDTLSVQLPSGAYTEVKASREVVTHEHPVTINDSYTLGDLTQTRQGISGLVLVDRQLPQDKIDNVTNFMEVKAGLTL